MADPQGFAAVGEVHQAFSVLLEGQGSLPSLPRLDEDEGQENQSKYWDLVGFVEFLKCGFSTATAEPLSSRYWNPRG